MGGGAFLVALVLFVFVLGILIFIYMLLVKPEGTLTVTYRLTSVTAEPAREVAGPPAEEMKTCPRCAEEVRAAALVCRCCGYEFPPLDRAHLGRWLVRESVGPTFVVGTKVELSRPGPSIILSVAGRSYWIVPAAETTFVAKDRVVQLKHGREEVDLEFLDGPPRTLIVAALRSVDRAPNANAYAERVIETMRAECLDWTLIWGRRHLDRTLRTYGEHYNRGRPHRALGLASPLAAAGEPISANPREVRRRDLLGGLIHEYHGAAA